MKEESDGRREGEEEDRDRKRDWEEKKIEMTDNL